MNLYAASNETPPPVMFEDGEYVNTESQARAKLKKLDEWNSVLFIFTHGMFLPVLKAEANLKIKDFKYIIQITK